MRYNNIPDILNAFSNLKVLILGDVMVDSYINGSVSRISPEAPVPVMNVHSKEKRLGGAANVALNVQSLGAQPILCSIIGDDPEAMEFIHLLEKRGMDTRGIIKSNKRHTTIKHRVISGAHHLIRIDEEKDQPLDDIDQKALLSHIEELMSLCDVIIFEDYDKGCLDEIIISSTIRSAQNKKIPTAVDPKKRNFLSYEGASLFKPNLHELKEGLKLDFSAANETSIKNAVDQLLRKMPFENALITLSEHGIYYQGEGASGRLPAHLRSIADVSGAGDTVISIASLCLALGLPLDFTAELANLGGGIVCEYPGVVPIDIARLTEESSHNELLANYFQ